ncbi:MAG: hypothetical protein ABIJ15_01105 [bacterium]
MEKRFDYPQALKLAKVFDKHRVKYMFIGKSGAIILGRLKEFRAWLKK